MGTMYHPQEAIATPAVLHARPATEVLRDATLAIPDTTCHIQAVTLAPTFLDVCLATLQENA